MFINGCKVFFIESTFCSDPVELIRFYPQENAALCDEVAHLEEKFLRAKEERRRVAIFQICF